MSLALKNTTPSKWNALHSKLSSNFMFLRKYKPQINADERRFIIWLSTFMEFIMRSNKIKWITKMLHGVGV